LPFRWPEEKTKKTGTDPAPPGVVVVWGEKPLGGFVPRGGRKAWIFLFTSSFQEGLVWLVFDATGRGKKKYWGTFFLFGV